MGWGLRRSPVLSLAVRDPLKPASAHGAGGFPGVSGGLALVEWLQRSTHSELEPELPAAPGFVNEEHSSFFVFAFNSVGLMLL